MADGALLFYPNINKASEGMIFKHVIPRLFGAERDLRKWFGELPYPIRFAATRVSDKDLVLCQINNYSGVNAFNLAIYVNIKGHWSLLALSNEDGIPNSRLHGSKFYAKVAHKEILLRDENVTIAHLDFTPARHAVALLEK